jgi:hypothetical protein
MTRDHKEDPAICLNLHLIYEMFLKSLKDISTFESWNKRDVCVPNVHMGLKDDLLYKVIFFIYWKYKMPS